MTSLSRYLLWWVRDAHPRWVFSVALVGVACLCWLGAAVWRGETAEILACLGILVVLSLLVALEAIVERVARRMGKRRGQPVWRVQA